MLYEIHSGNLYDDKEQRGTLGGSFPSRLSQSFSVFELKYKGRIFLGRGALTPQTFSSLEYFTGSDITNSGERCCDVMDSKQMRQSTLTIENSVYRMSKKKNTDNLPCITDQRPSHCGHGSQDAAVARILCGQAQYVVQDCKLTIFQDGTPVRNRTVWTLQRTLFKLFFPLSTIQ